MRIAIIDADLIANKNHRFPNLAAMKLSGYYKELGATVHLKTNYEKLDRYHQVYISKVFTETKVAPEILALPNVSYGGTGFYYDKAPKLPYEIEHHMPDYHLYDNWLSTLPKKDRHKEYTDYSIGFLTRGCFRGCKFCINQNSNKIVVHSPLSEFYDPTRKKICLLDDNFLGYHKWKPLLEELIAADKPFKFKQGLDERLLTPEKWQMLLSAKYDENYTFAFDNIADKDIVIRKLDMMREYTSTTKIIFYVLTGYDRNSRYNMNFWKQDILDMMERVFILGQYRVSPYIMRYERYKDSPFYGVYVTVAGWCNQFSTFKIKTLKEYCELCAKTNRLAPTRYMEAALKEIPELGKYYDEMAWRRL